MSGNNDWFDDFMDYKMSSSSGSSSGGNKSGGGRIPTWLCVLAIIGLVAGDYPINGFTILLILIFGGIIFIRGINS